MTQAGASARYRFDVAFVETINYNFYRHSASIPRIYLIRHLMKGNLDNRRPRFAVISTFLSKWTVSCNVNGKDTRLVSSRTRIWRRCLSPSTFPRVTEAHVRSADEGWHWNHESHWLLRKFPRQSQGVRSHWRTSHKPAENDGNEMNDAAGISREENYGFFFFLCLSRVVHSISWLARVVNV